jgi:hypothetical protein
VTRESGAAPILLLRAAEGALVGWALALVVLSSFRRVPEAFAAVSLLGSVVLISVIGTGLLILSSRPSDARRHNTYVRSQPTTPTAVSVPSGLGSAFSWADHAQRPAEKVWSGIGSTPTTPPPPAVATPAADVGPSTNAVIPVSGGAWYSQEANGEDGSDVFTLSADPPHVVQCPNCGDFGPTARAQSRGFAFRCERCGHPWSWTPGEPWPTTVVLAHRAK